MSFNRRKIENHNLIKLIATSAIVSLSSFILVVVTQHLTEHLEHILFETVYHSQPLYFILMPTIGITAIYFLRKHLFKGRKNKGITEIYKTLDQRKEHLPSFKIPSHLINGFLTVAFGGSTGIEVSSVVASATTGNMVHKQNYSANLYKKELICAGVTAAVSILFASPLAGILFAIEVIARKKSKTIFISCGTSALICWVYLLFFGSSPLFDFPIETWNTYALPFFLILSLVAGLLSVYFTFLVTRMKHLFSHINNNFIRVNLGAITVGLLILLSGIIWR